MDLTNIFGTLNAAIVTADGLKGLVEGLTGSHSLKAKHVEMLTKVVDAKINLLTLKEQMMAMREEIEGYDKFQQRADAYELYETPAGGFVYRTKAQAVQAQPVHNICPTCFSDNKITVLQSNGRLLACKTCGNTFENSPAPKPGLAAISTRSGGIY